MNNREKKFSPKIVAFCCNWCSYAGADLAGVMRLQMAADFSVVRVMCSARISPEIVIKALQSGADGVLVLGCHIGDCHYVDGNHRTKKRFALLRRMLPVIGIEAERIFLDWVSASEGARFQKVITDFVEGIRRLGPNLLQEEARMECGSEGK